MKRAVKQAFTLIELMVVIAIIGVLIALLMPAINTAIAKGKEASCLSNLHQHGVALMGYGAANRGHTLEWGSTNQGRWMATIEPYLSAGAKGAVRICPVAKQVASGSGDVHGTAHMGWRVSGAAGTQYEGSYAVNTHITSVDSSTNNTYRRLADTDSSVPAFIDGAWWETEAVTGVTWPNSLEGGSNWILDRHRKGVCISYTDGHSARVELAMIFDQQWSPTYTRAGRQTCAKFGIK